MSTTKEKAAALKDKIALLAANKKQIQEKAEVAQAEIEEKLTKTAYDVFKNKDGKYMVAIIKYDGENVMSAVVEAVVPATNKIVALRHGHDKRDFEKLMLKGRRKK